MDYLMLRNFDQAGYYETRLILMVISLAIAFYFLRYKQDRRFLLIFGIGVALNVLGKFGGVVGELNAVAPVKVFGIALSATPSLICQGLFEGGIVGLFAFWYADLRSARAKSKDWRPFWGFCAAVVALSFVAGMISQSLKLAQMVEQEKAQLVDENAHLKRELQQKYDFRNIIGTSKEMREIYEQVAQVAHTNTTVLIRGESGTGKELVAHAIHYNSPRAAKPFVKVNCAALPESLIEAELFGHEKGAFTGAIARKRGRFELAEGGTLFLDEIGDLSPAMQVKLLRVLQEREFERVGGTETIKVNVRLIAATNVDLETAVSDGRFRSDLYYRLNVFSIYLPPLRERKTDILLLADHFLEKYAHQSGKRIRRISTPAIDMLMSYHWPGNVRELENVIERATLVCDGNVVHGFHMPPSLQTAEGSGTVTKVGLDHAVGAFEKELIQDALKTARGNRARAARMLDTTERILGYKVKKYEIDCNRFKG